MVIKGSLKNCELIFSRTLKAGRVGSKRQLEPETARRRAGPAVFRANNGRPSNPLTSCIPDFYNYDVVHGVHGLKVSPVGRKGGLVSFTANFYIIPDKMSKKLF